MNTEKELSQYNDKVDLNYFLKSEVIKDFNKGYFSLQLFVGIIAIAIFIILIINFSILGVVTSLIALLLNYIFFNFVRAVFILRDVTYLKCKQDLKIN